MRNEFLTYMEKIWNMYKDCDTAHRTAHISAVWDRAQYIASCVNENINEEILMCACYYHDLGCLIDRKQHNIHSGRMVRNDSILKEFFSDKEIELIVEAVEDHRTSIDAVPRNIYGKILKDADKDNDVDESLRRAFVYAKEKGIGSCRQEWLNATFTHLNEKFGENGSVKYYILPNDKNDFFMQMKNLALDKDAFVQRMKNIE